MRNKVWDNCHIELTCVPGPRTQTFHCAACDHLIANSEACAVLQVGPCDWPSALYTRLCTSCANDFETRLTDREDEALNAEK